jgi:signal transduction histidine kinase
MIPFVNDMHLALAVAPVVSALAIRGLWSRRQLDSELREREERARVARQEALDAMREAMSAAKAAQRSREEFLARMSHELRTPLNAVIGFSRVLESNRAGNQRPEDIALLGRVRAGGEQLLRLVEDVLDQSQIERGQLELTLEETDVGAVVNRVADAYRAAAAAKGLNLRVAMTPSSTGMRASLDAARFRQVVEKLVDNAIKFTARGTILLELVTEVDGRLYSLSVADSGIGIPGNRLADIFEPFEQLDSSLGRSHGGAGLGLPLAQRLCWAMGCELSVQSQVGAGSRFTIRFPVHRQAS